MHSTKDCQGNEYARLSQLKPGDKIQLDSGFDCASGIKTVMAHGNELYFECSAGKHLLEGQADDGDHLVGIYHA